MLSDRDQRIFREIEQHLHDDKHMASISRHAERSERRLQRATDVAMVLAALSAVLCFALATRVTAGAGAVAAALFVVLALVSARRHRRGRTAAMLRGWWTRARRAWATFW